MGPDAAPVMEDVPAAPERSGAATMWFNIAYERVSGWVLHFRDYEFLSARCSAGCTPVCVTQSDNNRPPGRTAGGRTVFSSRCSAGCRADVRWSPHLCLTLARSLVHTSTVLLPLPSCRRATCLATTAAQTSSCTSPAASGRRAPCWRLTRRRPVQRAGPSSGCGTAAGGPVGKRRGGVGRSTGLPATTLLLAGRDGSA